MMVVAVVAEEQEEGAAGAVMMSAPTGGGTSKLYYSFIHNSDTDRGKPHSNNVGSTSKYDLIDDSLREKNPLPLRIIVAK